MTRKYYWLAALVLLIAIALATLLALPQIVDKLIEKQLEAQLQGSATIERVSLQWRSGIIDIKGLEATDHSALTLRSGDLSIDIALRDLLNGRYRGAVNLQDALIDYGDLTLKLQQLTFAGELLESQESSAEGIASTQWSVNGTLGLQAVGLFDRVRELTLLTLGDAQIADATVSLEPMTISVPSVTLSSLGAVNPGEDDKRWLYAEDLRLDSILFADNRIEIAMMSGTGVRSVAQISADGELETQGVLSASLDALEKQLEPDKTEAAQEPGEPFQYRIGNIDVAESELHITDFQFERPLTLTLLIDSLSLGTIDSLAPQAATTLDLDSRVGEYSTIKATGAITPLDVLHSLALKGDIQSLPLPLVSPYIERLLGYELTSGQFDHVFEMTIANEHIVATNEIDLRKVAVTRLKEVEPTAPLPISLNRGLDLLRDRDGHIHLSVPLEGNLDDPEIGVDQIISTALGKSMTSGSATLLKFALQPYGAILMGAEMGLKMANKIRLEPMQFEPLQSDLQGEQLDYAGKIADLMLDRPKLDLSVCGIAGAADAQALVASGKTTDLSDLAKQRSAALKNWLHTEKDIPHERLFECKAKVDPESDISGINLEF